MTATAKIYIGAATAQDSRGSAAATSRDSAATAAVPVDASGLRTNLITTGRVDVTDYGIATGNTGLQNRTALVSLVQRIPAARGNTLYWPTGSYQLAPVSRAVLAEMDLTCISWSGDGRRSTLITLSESADWLLDYNDLDCHDCYFGDLSLSGGDLCAEGVMRLNSAARHYRIAFRDMTFRDSLKDGVLVSDCKNIRFRGVSFVSCVGWGPRLRSTPGIAADFDVSNEATVNHFRSNHFAANHFASDHFRATGSTGSGVLIEKNDSDRANTVISGLYTVASTPAIKIDAMSGVVLNQFDAGQNAVMDNGAAGNYLFGNPGTGQTLVTDDKKTFLNSLDGYNAILGLGTVESGSDSSLTWMAHEEALNRMFKRVPDGALPSPVSFAAPSGVTTSQMSLIFDLNTVVDGFAQLRLRRTGNCRIIYDLRDRDTGPNWMDWSPRLRQWLLFTDPTNVEEDIFVDEGDDAKIWIPIPGPENRPDVELNLKVIGQDDPNQRVDLYSWSVL